MIEFYARASYHQYWVADSMAEVSWPDADETDDCVLGPLPAGVRCTTGTQEGYVRLQVHMLTEDTAPDVSVVLDNEVASIVTVQLSSGAMVVHDLEYSQTATLSLTPGSEWYRLLLVVHGRDERVGKLWTERESAERHELFIWPGSDDGYRACSETMDWVGEQGRKYVESLGLPVWRVSAPAPGRR